MARCLCRVSQTSLLLFAHRLWCPTSCLDLSVGSSPPQLTVPCLNSLSLTNMPRNNHWYCFGQNSSLKSFQRITIFINFPIQHRLAHCLRLFDPDFVPSDTVCESYNLHIQQRNVGTGSKIITTPLFVLQVKLHVINRRDTGDMTYCLCLHMPSALTRLQWYTSRC